MPFVRSLGLPLTLPDTYLHSAITSEKKEVVLTGFEGGGVKTIMEVQMEVHDA